LAAIRRVGHALGDRIEAERRAGGPFTDLVDLARRTDAGRLALEALATAGALGSLVGTDERRSALWAAGAVAASGSDRLAGVVTGVEAPTLPGMVPVEVAAADLWSTGVTPGVYPTELFRDGLAARGVVTAGALRDVPHGTRVWVGGVVTHRQRPATAGGTTFVNLEDESGLVNVICSKGVWSRYRRVARGAPALLIRGILERTEAVHPGGADDAVVLNVIADRIEALVLPLETGPARDFH
jgi:error-prone DNA polymerase